MVVGLGQKKLMRTEWYPQPHQMRDSWAYELDDNTIDTTCYPIIMHDEGLGTPSDQETHPENAAFALVNRPNCFVNSRVNKIKGQLTFALTSKALDDNIPAVKCYFMVTKMAFKENYVAIDELSTAEVQDVFKLQTESTDRQGYPLWNGTKMATKYTNSGLLDAAVPGLTTDQQIEGVAFSPTSYYNAIHYQTIAGITKASARGLKFITLTPNRPVAKIRIHIDSKVKRMNEYTFFGLIVGCQSVDNEFQYVTTADITAATKYVYADVVFRYNEWNGDFNFKRV